MNRALVSKLPAVFGLAVSIACAAGAGEPIGAPAGAPLLEGMGDHHHPITTDDPLAQRYFDQGIVLAWGFNHAESVRSFRAATQRDPECAMCWWGVAFVLGPNINHQMTEEAVGPAYEALSRAVELAPRASERERSYIEALSRRYGPAVVEDRTPLDRAYADAMRQVARRYPDDAEATTLYAEALMNLHPWDFWGHDVEPHPWTPEILEVLERAMATDPRHPGANHLYIHVSEASPTPERALEQADRLRHLVPGAGHLVHMPSHVYIRLGLYDEAIAANRRAIAADERYLRQAEKQGVYAVMYKPHNRHFLWAAAALAGRSELALATAREMRAHTDPEELRGIAPGTVQHYWTTPLYAGVRFGRWQAILDEPEPPEDLPYPRGVWHYARALALVRKGEADAARQELEALSALVEEPALEETLVWRLNSTAHLLRIARAVAGGEIAAARGDYTTAIEELMKGLALEKALTYDEPPPWHQPVRQVLGAVLLEGGRAAEAEEAYRADLERFRDNGWSLFGLAQALEAQGRTEEAAVVRARFEEAWAAADVRLTASRF